MKNKIILITGGANGIGLCLVNKLSKNNKVIVIDSDKKNFFKWDNSKNVIFFNSDVTDETEMLNIYNKLISDKLTLDIIINNASVQEENNFYDISLKSWRKIIDINLTGVFIISQIFTKILNSKGTILNVLSVHHDKPRLNKFHYDASKSGVAMLTKEMALFFADKGITVNGISFGATLTNMNADWKDDKIKVEKIKSKIPLRKINTADEIAELIIKIINNFSEFTTGSIFTIDGGRSLT